MYGARWGGIFSEPGGIEDLGLRAAFRGLDIAAGLDGATGESLGDETVFDVSPAAGKAACPDLSLGWLAGGNYQGLIEEPDKGQ